jgi:hypothetical protein
VCRKLFSCHIFVESHINNNMAAARILFCFSFDGINKCNIGNRYVKFARSLIINTLKTFILKTFICSSYIHSDGAKF